MSNVEGIPNAQITKHNLSSFDIRASSFHDIHLSFVISSLFFAVRKNSEHLSTCSGSRRTNQRARSERSTTNKQRAETRSREAIHDITTNAKSQKCAGQPRAPQTRHQIRQRLSRSPIKTFPLRQRRDHERQILGLSRSQNPQAHFSLFVDPTAQRRRTREWNDLQPVRGGIESRRHRTRSQSSRRHRG